MRILLTMLMVCLLGQQALAEENEHAVCEPCSFEYTYRMRVQALTEKAAAIANPVSWLPVKSLAEDGAKVEKGDVIAEFDPRHSIFDLKRMQNELAVVEADLHSRLAKIDNQGSEMRDSLDALRDKLVVLQARQKRLQSLPLEDDVRIAEGRHRVALLNEQAAARDLQKGRDRFQRKMISQAELDRFDQAWQETSVRLQFARNELQYAKLGASESSLQIVALEIENAQLEIRKLENELTEYEQLSAIKKEGAQSRKKRLERRIAEKQEDIDRTVVRAPISGYVSYGSGGRNDELGVGSKLWKNFTFMRIPDLRTLAFKGVMHETVRNRFREGDSVVVRCHGRAGTSIAGRITSISTMSHDLAEKAEANWGNVGREFGVKVFDVAIEMETVPDWLRPGMFGQAEVTASQPVSGPGVPLRFVRVHEGESFLSVAGRYEAAPGTVVGGWFVLEDEAWLGRRVSMRGEFRERGSASAGIPEGRFTVSGELLPVKSLNVVVGDFGRIPWPKVTWLVPEETSVTEGQVVAKLETREIDQKITDREIRVNERDGKAKEAAKQLDLARREGEFKVKTEQNKLRIAELNLRITEAGRDSPAIFAAARTRDLAKITLDSIARKLERQQGKKRPTLSPAELARLQRDKRRSELKLRQAELKLQELLDGASDLERSAARLALVKQRVLLDVTRKQAEIDVYKKNREYQRAKLYAERGHRRLQRLHRQREGLTIKSPGSGIIRYNKIWNSGSLSKVNVGSVVGKQFSLMSLPDLSQMQIRIEIPEVYFSQVTADVAVKVRLPSLNDTVVDGKVTSIDYVFENRSRKDSQVGLYSSHEPLGEVIFNACVSVQADGLKLKPGTVAEVIFPFRRIGEGDAP